MRKLILTSLAVAALAGAGVAQFAFAAPGDSPDGSGMHWRGPSPEQRALMLDAHLAGMKAALKLTPDQEKVWAPFESAVRDAAKARGDEMRAMREHMQKGERPNPIDFMNEMSDHLSKASSELKQVADAAKPLYDSLNDTQKRDFGPLLRTLRPHHGMRGPWGHRGGDEQP